jgi:membrane glycosyltransferase
VPTPPRHPHRRADDAAQRGSGARHRPARIVKDSIDATGEGGQFDYFVLSDTNDPDIAAAEEKAASPPSRPDAGEGPVVYRRRTDNAGFKAGNVRDFCDRWGAATS